jgi:hypothetical protein
MPFAKYDVDPAHIEAMRLAFRKVCDALRISCEPGDLRADLIATKIVDLARAGELNPNRLCYRVLLDLAQRPKED